jgi:hypothetical protein
MSVTISGDTGLAGAATGALNGSLGATTPSTVVATTISASGVITATGGVVVGASAAPAFSAYLSSNQSVTSATLTKVTLNTEEFDTNSNFNSTTYRFTPTVAGYYQISASIQFGSGSNTSIAGVYIYKNGVNVKNTITSYTSAILNYTIPCVTAVVFLNGSTDYIELYGYNTASTTPNFNGSSASTCMSGAMVRSA